MWPGVLERQTNNSQVRGEGTGHELLEWMPLESKHWHSILVYGHSLECGNRMGTSCRPGYTQEPWAIPQGKPRQELKELPSGTTQVFNNHLMIEWCPPKKVLGRSWPRLCQIKNTCSNYTWFCCSARAQSRNKPMSEQPSCTSTSYHQQGV